MALNQDVDSGQPGKPYVTSAVEMAEVAEPGPALSGMLENICRIQTLLGGTEAMRAARFIYLPQHPYETTGAYNNRINVCYLDDYVGRTLSTLTGKAFKDPPQPGEGMPDTLLEFMDDVDDAGTAFVPFTRAWFRKGVEQAVAHVLVDMSAAPLPAVGTVRSLADDNAAGMRPFWRLIPAEDMLDFQVGKLMIDGKVKTLPTLIRFRDDEVRPAGLFGSVLVERVKVITPGVYQIWEKKKGPRGGKPRWVLEEEGRYGLPQIPVVTFYTDKTGLAEGRSPIAGLAHLNVRHWQSTADQINILTVSRFPMLAASGVRDAEGEGGQGQIVVGPNKFLTTPDPQSKIYYVEHTGAAVLSGTGELERLEQAMSSYGAEFLKKGTQGPETASGRVLDAGDAISPLQSWGLDFKDCMEQALWFTAQWMKMGDIETPVDFEVESEVDMANQAELTFLSALRTGKDISREAILDEGKRRGILPEDFDIEADKQRIDDEPPPPGMGLDGMGKALTGVPAAPVKKPAAPVKKVPPKK